MDESYNINKVKLLKVMYKVKIKKQPTKMEYGGGVDDTKVSNTMSAVPKEEANIEVEHGETAFGDVNNDTFAELMTFNGKRHSEGGIPVNIPDGTFIFSDTKDLKIKDDELIKKMFNLNKKKGGWTPADLSKKFPINDYMQTLKDPKSSRLAKDTAQRMLDKNVQKLGEIALIQESMKGFPKGIPDVAQAAMPAMGITPDMIMPQEASEESTEEVPIAKCGGAKKKYQEGGPVGFTSQDDYESFMDTIEKSDNPDIRESYNIFKSAMASKDNAEIDKAISFLNQVDIPGSIGMIPWSDQDKLQDFTGWLEGRKEHNTKSVQYETDIKESKRLHKQYLKALPKLKKSFENESDPYEKIRLEKKYNKVKQLMDKYPTPHGTKKTYDEESPWALSPSASPSHTRGKLRDEPFLFNQKVAQEGINIGELAGASVSPQTSVKKKGDDQVDYDALIQEFDANPNIEYVEEEF